MASLKPCINLNSKGSYALPQIKTAPLRMIRFSLLVYLGRASGSTDTLRLQADNRSEVSMTCCLCIFDLAALGDPVSAGSLPPPTRSCFTCMRCQTKPHCFTTVTPQSELNQKGLFIESGLQVCRLQQEHLRTF